MIQKLILKCKNDVINNIKITKLEASKLFNVDDEFITRLTEAANDIRSAVNLPLFLLEGVAIIALVVCLLASF